MQFHLGKPLLVMLVIGLVAGAWILARPAPPETDLTAWVFAGTHHETYGTLIEPFRQRTGKSVSLDLVQGRALRLRLASSFTTGRGDDLPDLVEVEINWIGQYFRPPIEHVGLLDLTDRLKASGWYDRMVQTRFAPWTKEGRIFGVPHDVHPVGLAYRHDLFWGVERPDGTLDGPGIDLTRCRTWYEFHEACLRFRRYWRDRGFQTRHAIEMPRASADHLVTLLLQRGVNLIDDRDRIHINHPKVAQTMAWYAQLVAGPRAVASESSGGPAAVTRDLQDGNIAAYITPDWSVANLKRYAVNKDDPSKDVTGKMRLMPLPVFDPTDPPTSTRGGTMIGIPKACPDPEAAWALIEWLYFSDAGLRARLVKTDILPPIRSQWADPRYHQPDPFFGSAKYNDPDTGASYYMGNELFVHLADQIPPRYAAPATPIATQTLTYVLNLATAHVEERGAEGLGQQCQLWLDDAARDLERRIRHWSFEPEPGE